MKREKEAASTTAPRFAAVLFDLGGVVLGSPFDAIESYERELGLPPLSINRCIAKRGHQGAFARLERGEISLSTFYQDFDREYKAEGKSEQETVLRLCFSAKELLQRMHRALTPNLDMLEVVLQLRTHHTHLKVAAVTNNWADELGRSVTAFLQPLFHVIIESYLFGVSKPDRHIFEIALQMLSFFAASSTLSPQACIFLDDIGRNLKTAKAMGMATIKVDREDPLRAIHALEALLQQNGSSPPSSLLGVDERMLSVLPNRCQQLVLDLIESGRRKRGEERKDVMKEFLRKEENKENDHEADYLFVLKSVKEAEEEDSYAVEWKYLRVEVKEEARTKGEERSLPNLSKRSFGWLMKEREGKAIIQWQEKQKEDETFKANL
ncbi:Acyl-CoA dehydrogenase member 10 [Balamuthia mandrillaris]